MTVVLETQGLAKRFGGLVAIDGVSLKIERGARHALIGPNGAGKTTLINLLTGVLEPTGGRVVLEGEDITTMASHRRVGRGMVRTFQISQLFGELTPLQSLSLALNQTMAQRTTQAMTQNATRQQSRIARWWQPLGRDRRVAERCEHLLAEFHLTDVMQQRSAVLPYGKRRLLEIALAIACEPRVLLLDEPAAGVPHGERQEIFDSLARLPADVSVLLIEHDMDLVFNFAKQVTVLVNGAVLAEGDVASISTDPRVKAAYLGQDDIVHG